MLGLNDLSFQVRLKCAAIPSVNHEMSVTDGSCHDGCCCLQGMCLSGADDGESRKKLTQGVMTQYKDMCEHCVISCDTAGPVATVTDGSECDEI